MSDITKDDISKLLKDPETLDQIARQILKRHNEKPLSQALKDFENEMHQLSDHEYLRDVPEEKSMITYEFIKSLTEKEKKEFLIKSEQKNLKRLAKINEKLKRHSQRRERN